MKHIVTFGGGTNSTALLIHFVKINFIPDHILFSDTGGEHPNTYKFIKEFNNYLISKNFPSIEILNYKTKNGKILNLYDDCINNKTLPSIAFGYKSCSQKFKIRPVEKFIKSKYNNLDIKIYIGFDYGEKRRIKQNANPNFTNCYPLIDLMWDRKKCIEVIKNENIDLPGKSSCFFCPNMKKNEILSLSNDLKAKIFFLEKNATNIMEVKGLGRNYKWTDLIKADNDQTKIDFNDEDWHSIPCECID